MDKRGQFMALITLLIIAFFSVVFFATWIFTMQTITDAFTDIPTTGGVNFTQAAEITVVPVNASFGMLRILAISIFFGMVIAMFVTNYFMRGEPLFFIFYILFMIVSVIFSVILSNTYEVLIRDDVLGTALQTFIGMNFVLLNLPLVITVIGIFGAIFLFTNASRESQESLV